MALAWLASKALLYVGRRGAGWLSGLVKDVHYRCDKYLSFF
jgi:hypothetical protein